MIQTENKLIRGRAAGAGMALLLLFSGVAPAQSTSGARGRQTAPAQASTQASAQTASQGEDAQFDVAYRNFYQTYRLGPGDQIAVRVQGQPEYSKDLLKVSPVGAIYLELLGDVQLAGMTLDQAREHLTRELGEYLKDPKVTVSLLDAVIAKVGVLGEVLKPGIIVMSRPLNLMDAIIEAGGFANTGSKTSVEVISQTAQGGREPRRFNVKRILEGKASPAENPVLQPGDIVYVHGNTLKTISTVTALAGFGSFLSFMQLGRR